MAHAWIVFKEACFQTSPLGQKSKPCWPMRSVSSWKMSMWESRPTIDFTISSAKTKRFVNTLRTAAWSGLQQESSLWCCCITLHYPEHIQKRYVCWPWVHRCLFLDHLASISLTVPLACAHASVLKYVLPILLHISCPSWTSSLLGNDKREGFVSCNHSVCHSCIRSSESILNSILSWMPT